MKVEILKCSKCNKYTMERKCSECNGECLSNKPAKFSIEDKWGKYRRIAKGLEQ